MVKKKVIVADVIQKQDVSNIEKIIEKIYKKEVEKEEFIRVIAFEYCELVGKSMLADSYNLALKNLSQKLNNNELLNYKI